MVFQCLHYLSYFTFIVNERISHSRFILEGVGTSQAHLPKLLNYEEYSTRDKWEAYRLLIAVYLNMSSLKT
jgi:hypothetical protein